MVIPDKNDIFLFISIASFSGPIYFINNKVWRIYTINSYVAWIFDGHVRNMVNKNIFV